MSGVIEETQRVTSQKRARCTPGEEGSHGAVETRRKKGVKE